MPKLVLVDGSSYLFRAYHALPPLTNTKGIPTGAAYGVLNMLRKLFQDEQPDYIGVIFDTKSKNFRHEIYPAYKANRPSMPDELAVQIGPLHEMIQAMGFPLLAIEGIEADDVLATLAEHAKQKGVRTVISTGDKDLAQLVDDDKVTLVNTMTGSVMNEDAVLAKFGVAPNQIIDYLALVGDPVDNVPGVPKVGPKTAAKWLQEFGTLENLIKNADSITGKIGENLRAHLDHLPLGKELVTVKRDMPLAIDFDDLKRQPQQRDKLRVLFQEFEFKSWLKELDKEAEPVAKQERGCYETIFSQEVFLEWLEKIKQHKSFAIDIIGDLVGIGLAVTPNHGIYVPLQHDYVGAPKQLDLEWFLEQFKPVLEDPHIAKISKNLKEVMHAFARCDIQLNGIGGDTMMASYVLNSTATRHDIESLAKYYLQYEPVSSESIIGKGAKQIPFNQVEVAKTADYAGEMADLTLRLHQLLTEKIAQVPSLKKVYEEIELPLIEVLWQMEEYGVCLDSEKLKNQSETLAKAIANLEEQAIILAGRSFNLSSPKQLQEILFDELKLPVLEKTPTGAPSTGESVLQALSENYELPKIILQHRTLSKIKSTYADKLPLQVSARVNRVHTSYQQAVTTTGRLSSTDPNLQNIPIRTEEGRKIRQAFVPAKGYVLISADYSQIELRIMAHLSQDEGLLNAFRQNQDIHRFTASEVLGIPLEEVTSEQRRSAKAINFGLIYGMSSFGLSKQLEINRKEADVYMAQYFTRYPKVKDYMENARHFAQKHGYVETILGRRVYLPDIQGKNFMRKRAAERAAINGPMQGTAADIIKMAMITLHQKLKGQSDIKMLMQVHDELVFEVKPEKQEQAIALIRDCMQNAVTLSVPLVVDVGVGQNWDEAH